MYSSHPTVRVPRFFSPVSVEGARCERRHSIQAETNGGSQCGTQHEKRNSEARAGLDGIWKDSFDPEFVIYPTSVSHQETYRK